MTNSVNPMDIGQSDYMKLFMQELMYQDPLKPVDNREFMAQMAQFSLVQQATVTSEKTNELLLVSYDNQLISLLGKQIKIPDQLSYVQVESLNLEAGHVKSLKVRTEENQRIDITREQITEILAV